MFCGFERHVVLRDHPFKYFKLHTHSNSRPVNRMICNTGGSQDVCHDFFLFLVRVHKNQKKQRMIPSHDLCDVSYVESEPSIDRSIDRWELETLPPFCFDRVVASEVPPNDVLGRLLLFLLYVPRSYIRRLKRRRWCVCVCVCCFHIAMNQLWFLRECLTVSVSFEGKDGKQKEDDVCGWRLESIGMGNSVKSLPTVAMTINAQQSVRRRILRFPGASRDGKYSSLPLG